MPAPIPSKLLLLNGRGEGRDSGGRPVPKPPNFKRQAPNPPSWLSREARAEWRRVVPALEKLDLVKLEDRSTLAAYCEVWSTFVRAQRDVDRNGLTVTNRSVRKDGTESTWTTKNPSVAVALAAATQLRHYAGLFGLNPAAERNLGTTDPEVGDDGNPFAPPDNPLCYE